MRENLNAILLLFFLFLRTSLGDANVISLNPKEGGTGNIINF